MTGLGLAGLTPFYLLAVLSLLPHPELQDIARRGFGIYSLAILCFLAGSLWGSANVRGEGDKIERLLVSNMITVLGATVLLLLNPLAMLLCMAALHLIQCQYELRRGAGGWYGSLRQRLTRSSLPSYCVVGAGIVIS